MNKSPKISIITISFNSENTIKETIESVLSQDYKNIEYIIIDGNSTDKTKSIIGSYRGKISYFVSEKDNGIYDAMNKGIKSSTGDIIGILNSDDFYMNNSVISEVVDKITKCNSDTLYADLLYVNPEDTNIIKRYWKSGEFNRVKFEKGWMLPHPTFFVKKEIYNKFGLYSDKLKSAADYEMILRLLYKNNVSTTYLNKITVKMRDGGYSNQSFWSRIKGNKEDIKSWKMNNLKAPTFLRIRKPLSKISQYIKKPKNNE